jgi:putative tryptophan/tyrosine transport system substrate-binding protein
MEDATGAPSSFADWYPKRLRASGRDGEEVMTESPSALTMLLSRHTKRREFIAGLGAAAWPLAARAQQDGRLRRVGLLQPGAENDPERQDRKAALQEGLTKLGWIEGRNLRIEGRFGVEPALTDKQAAELVSLGCDVIVVNTTPATRALKKQTRTIPIVFVSIADPISTGIVENIARPEANITGFSNTFPSLGGRWLELLKEAVPRIRRVALLFAPGGSAISYLSSIESAAPALALTTIRTPIQDSAESVERAIAAFAAEPNSGLLVLPDAVTVQHRETIFRLAVEQRLPSIYSDTARAGQGLLAYGTDNLDLWRRSGSYVDRILRGTKVSELPVQFPTKFELVVNLKTAKALGLDVPPKLLALADEVIE